MTAPLMIPSRGSVQSLLPCLPFLVVHPRPEPNRRPEMAATFRTASATGGRAVSLRNPNPLLLNPTPLAHVNPTQLAHAGVAQDAAHGRPRRLTDAVAGAWPGRSWHRGHASGPVGPREGETAVSTRGTPVARQGPGPTQEMSARGTSAPRVAWRGAPFRATPW